MPATLRFQIYLTIGELCDVLSIQLPLPQQDLDALLLSTVAFGMDPFALLDRTERVRLSACRTIFG